jgi:hypothetical protein
MRGFKLGKELAYRPELSFPRILKALADAFIRIGAGGNIEQVLVSLGILHDGGRFSVYGEHEGTFALLEMLDELAGGAAECGEGLDVGSDVEHGGPPGRAPYSVLSG